MKQWLFTGMLWLVSMGMVLAQHTKEIKEINKPTMKQNILVAFFSRADENYAVGYIEKGNTQIVAEMIAAELGADRFHIETLNPYPASYNPCIEVAKREKATQARPAIKGDVRVEDYEVVYLGYPNWWGDMPMAVYTFIEKHDWQGKTVVPFCTHEGSGLSGTERRIQEACSGARVLEGFALRGSVAQQKPEEARMAVQAWLQKLQN